MVWWAMFGALLLGTTPAPPPSTVPPSTVPPAPDASAPTATLPAGAGDPLGCQALVFDPGQELDLAEVTTAATRAAATLGADLHVRAERNLDGGLDVRMAQLQAQCPTWNVEGSRAGDLVVVMYSSTEREASVFYGAAQADRLEFRWEHAVDEMGPQFASGDFTGGVVAGLAALRQYAPVTYAPTFSPTQYDDDDTSASPGVPPVIWLGLAALVVVAVVRVGRFVSTGEWESPSDDGDDRSSWGSSRRSSSGWRSSSSSRRSSRASSSPSRRRSSGRSGGGTKRW